MIQELRIENFAIIDQLELTFAPGRVRGGEHRFAARRGLFRGHAEFDLEEFGRVLGRGEARQREQQQGRKTLGKNGTAHRYLPYAMVPRQYDSGSALQRARSRPCVHG